MKKYKIGQKIKFKDGRIGIVEDYTDKFVYIKDEHGKQIKKSLLDKKLPTGIFEQIYILTEQQANELKEEIESFYEESNLNIKCEMLEEINIDGVKFQKLKIEVKQENQDWSMVGIIIPIKNSEYNSFNNEISGDVPEEYKYKDGTICEECNVKRKRYSTVLVKANRNLKDKFGNSIKQGEYKQLGSECVDKYTGIDGKLTTEFSKLLKKFETKSKSNSSLKELFEKDEYEKRGLKKRLSTKVKLAIIKYLNDNNYKFNYKDYEKVISYIENEDLNLYKSELSKIDEWVRDENNAKLLSKDDKISKDRWIKTLVRESAIEIPSPEYNHLANIISKYYMNVNQKNSITEKENFGKTLRKYCIYAAKNNIDIKKVLENKPNVENLDEEFNSINEFIFKENSKIKRIWEYKNLDEEDDTLLKRIIYYLRENFYKNSNQNEIITLNIKSIDEVYDEYSVKEALNLCEKILVKLTDENNNDYVTVIDKEIPIGQYKCEVLGRAKINGLNGYWTVVEILGETEIENIQEINETAKEEIKEIVEEENVMVLPNGEKITSNQMFGFDSSCQKKGKIYGRK